MNVAEGDERVPQCVVGERLIDRGRRVWRIDQILWREQKIFLTDELSGRLELITFARLWRDYEHYISWAESYIKQRGW